MNLWRPCARTLPHGTPGQSFWRSPGAFANAAAQRVSFVVAPREAIQSAERTASIPSFAGCIDREVELFSRPPKRTRAPAGDKSPGKELT